MNIRWNPEINLSTLLLTLTVIGGGVAVRAHDVERVAVVEEQSRHEREMLVSLADAVKEGQKTQQQTEITLGRVAAILEQLTKTKL